MKCPKCNNNLIMDVVNDPDTGRLTDVARCNNCGHQETLSIVDTVNASTGITLGIPGHYQAYGPSQYTTSFAPASKAMSEPEVYDLVDKSCDMIKQYTDSEIAKVVNRFEKVNKDDKLNPLVQKLDIFKSKLLDLASFIDEIIDEEVDNNDE